jgi:hypothetical protein
MERAGYRCGAFAALAFSGIVAACTDSTSPSPQPPLAIGNAEAQVSGNALDETALGVMPAITPATPIQPAAIYSTARVQFAPIVGSTVDAITPLSNQLALRASQRGVVLVRNGDAGATHIVKGYFSAISDNGETLVIYVWDLLDPAGNRLHRIQGQEIAVGAAGEGWQAVPAETMEAVADRTIDQLAEWLAARQT